MVLDEATGRWGIPRQPRGAQGHRPSGHDPGGHGEADARRARPPRRDSHGGGREAVADPDRRRQKRSSILRAEGAREAEILRAGSQSKAIEQVFAAIHEGDPDPKLLAYQYLQTLPKIAQGEASKVWIIPSEILQALSNIGSIIPKGDTDAPGQAPPPPESPPPR